MIGASKAPMKPSGHPLYSLCDNKYNGRIYPVNPKYNKIKNLKCYHSIMEIEDEIDMVIICVPVSNVLEVVKACCKKKVKSIVILT